MVSILLSPYVIWVRNLTHITHLTKRDFGHEDDKTALVLSLMDPVYFLDSYRLIESPTAEDTARYIITRWNYSDKADFGIHEPVDCKTATSSELLERYAPEGFTQDSKYYRSVKILLNKVLKEYQSRD
jgi:hypothetical protein